MNNYRWCLQQVYVHRQVARFIPVVWKIFSGCCCKGTLASFAALAMWTFVTSMSTCCRQVLAIARQVYGWPPGWLRLKTSWRRAMLVLDRWDKSKKARCCGRQRHLFYRLLSLKHIGRLQLLCLSNIGNMLFHCNTADRAIRIAKTQLTL